MPHPMVVDVSASNWLWRRRQKAAQDAGTALANSLRMSEAPASSARMARGRAGRRSRTTSAGVSRQRRWDVNASPIGVENCWRAYLLRSLRDQAWSSPQRRRLRPRGGRSLLDQQGAFAIDAAKAPAWTISEGLRRPAGSRKASSASRARQDAHPLIRQFSRRLYILLKRVVFCWEHRSSPALRSQINRYALEPAVPV